MPAARPRLRRGDTIGVVATGFAVRRRPLMAGLAQLERMGYAVRCGEHLLARDGYLAGDDEQRLEDLETMLRDPVVRAVWFARGGYGSSRLLERVPWAAHRRDPKLLIGYSDLTSLFAGALRAAGTRCLYGPVVVELGDPRRFHAASLRHGLAGRGWTLSVRRRALAGGRARGRLVGGNLCVLTALCGTRFLPDLTGTVLFLEDVGEQTYRVDRMLTQLRQAGALSRPAAVLVGRIDVPARRRFPPDRAVDDVLREFLLPLGVPVLTGLSAGHGPGKLTLPLGAIAEVDADRRRVRFLP